MSRDLGRLGPQGFGRTRLCRLTTTGWCPRSKALVRPSPMVSLQAGNEAFTGLDDRPNIVRLFHQDLRILDVRDDILRILLCLHLILRSLWWMILYLSLTHFFHILLGCLIHLLIFIEGILLQVIGILSFLLLFRGKLRCSPVLMLQVSNKLLRRSIEHVAGDSCCESIRISCNSSFEHRRLCFPARRFRDGRIVRLGQYRGHQRLQRLLVFGEGPPHWLRWRHWWYQPRQQLLHVGNHLGGGQPWSRYH
mmetsp:Transcript_74586/g.118597  ORF Transcript_74586/g.118597 Transcript_74586/m.118597 type:complete len:250 (+) Transcript_74586:2631-3380(+)